jgi:hypothetical protein
MIKSEIKLDLTDISVAGNLAHAEDAEGFVIFVHSIGTTHSSAKNNFVTDVLNENHISTLIVDLLTEEEGREALHTTNIELLKIRLIRVTQKVLEQFAFDDMPIGYFGIGSGAAAALEASVFLGDTIKAIVSQSGQANLALNLDKVTAPTLFIAGSLENNVIRSDKNAYTVLSCDKKVEIINSDSGSLEEPAALNEVANLASAWFDLYLINNTIHTKTH